MPGRGLCAPAVEILELGPWRPRVASDLVQRQEGHVAVKGRVLDGLGHHRPRQLLEPPGHLRLRRSVYLQQEDLAQESQKLSVDLGTPETGRHDRPGHRGHVLFGSLFAGDDVRAVNTETGDHLGEAFPKFARRMVGMATVALAHLGHPVDEAGEVGRQRGAQHLDLGVVDQIFPRLLEAAEGPEGSVQRAGPFFLYKKAAGEVEPVITGGARHRPVRRELLAPLQYLLDQRPHAGAGVVEPFQVATGVA